MRGQPGHDIQPYARLPPSSLCMDARMTSQLKVAFIHKLVIDMHMVCISFDMLPTCICTTGHWQTSSRLVQELNVCTVASIHMYQTHSMLLISMCNTLLRLFSHVN